MANNVLEVQKMYIEYFGRPADPGGLNFWVNGLNNDPNAMAQIQRDFSGSAEYRSMYGGLSNRDVVLEVYENVFGRVGDAEGVAFWTAALDNNWITINNVVTEIVKAAHLPDLTVFNGRVAVATEFTNRLDNQVEVNAYMGPNAFGVANSFIDTIVDLSSAAAARNPSAIDAKIAEIVGLPQSVEAPFIV